MKKSTWFVLLLAWFLMTCRPVLADGIIIIDPPVEEIPPYLVIKYHRVTVTIRDQVATTHVDQVFVNPTNRRIEGTYVFPLPEGATINEFGMWVDGEYLAGEMLPADQARNIYEEIVRRQRDPALLEYVGRNTFRARIFPIEPRAEKRVEIEYSEVLPLDNGLIHYRYPLDTERFSPKPIEDVSIHVEIHSNEAIKAVYSSSHDVAVDRQGDYRVAVGYEAYDVQPDTDFDLYYTVAEEDVGLNLLSYAAGEDGFFLLLLAPRVEVDETEIIAKDVLLVLDKSGSMRGEKLAQAKEALKFVLDHLNEGDRFNIVEFSTGVRQFGRGLAGVAQRAAAAQWVDGLQAGGGTDINRAMLEALAQVDAERPTIIIFLTDGLPTEGVTDVERILSSVDGAAPDNVRIFTFGVGDDVNTLLLDRMALDHRGTSAYVRPGQSIDEQVSAFYAKVSTPVLSDINIDFGTIQVEDSYPYPLPDLFAGTQVLMAGRYRAGGDTIVTLRGKVNDETQTFVFDDVYFRSTGGPNFIPRLWATRKIGYLLNQIRLHGESPELVQEIVDLAVRYGIMTPYTSFLVQEDVEVFSERGRQETAEREYSVIAATPAAPSGKAAVDDAEAQRALETSDVGSGATGDMVKVVGDKAFLLRDGLWIDTTFDADRMTPLRVLFMSEDYFALSRARPEWSRYLAVAARVLVVLADSTGQPVAYEVVLEGEGDRIDLPAPAATSTPVAQPVDAPAATPTPVISTDPFAATPTPVVPNSSSGATSLCGSAAMLLAALGAAFWFARRK